MSYPVWNADTEQLEQTARCPCSFCRWYRAFMAEARERMLDAMEAASRARWQADDEGLDDGPVAPVRVDRADGLGYTVGIDLAGDDVHLVDPDRIAAAIDRYNDRVLAYAGVPADRPRGSYWPGFRDPEADARARARARAEWEASQAPNPDGNRAARRARARGRKLPTPARFGARS